MFGAILLTSRLHRGLLAMTLVLALAVAYGSVGSLAHQDLSTTLSTTDVVVAAVDGDFSGQAELTIALKRVGYSEAMAAYYAYKIFVMISYGYDAASIASMIGGVSWVLVPIIRFAKHLFVSKFAKAYITSW